MQPRLRFNIVAATVMATAIALASGSEVGAQPSPPRVANRRADATAKPSPQPEQCVQSWQTATAAAAKQNWGEAIRAGKLALAEHYRLSPNRPQEACVMLAALSYWHVRERDFSEAQAASRELLRLRQQLFTDDYWQTVDARLNVALIDRLAELSDDKWRQFDEAERLISDATAHQADGKLTEAIATAERALPLYVNLLGRDHPQTHNCLALLAACHLQLGQFAQAQPLVKEVIELNPNPKGVLHPDTVQNLKLLANFNAAVGDLANAEHTLRETVKICTVLQGEDHPEAVIVRVELAKVLSDQQKYDEAKPLLMAALDQQQSQLGNDHVATAQTKKILGALYAEQGNLAAAKLLLDQSVATFGKLAGERHLITASALNARGRLRLLAEDYQAAYDDLSTSMTICAQALGDHHPHTAKVLENLSLLYERGSNFGLARQSRLLCLETAEKCYGETNVLTADALEHVARLYINTNDFALAEPYLLRARETRRKLLGEDHPQTAKLAGQLAYVYLGAGDAGRAEPMFHEALSLLENSLDANTFEVAKIYERLALLNQSEGRYDVAEQHYRRALDLFKQQQVDGLRIAQAQVGLAQTLLSRGNTVAACQLIDQAQAAYQQRLHPHDPQWLDTLGVGGMAYLAAGDIDQARQLLTRGLQVAQVRLQMTGGYASERQRLMQLKSLRNLFDLYLSLPHDQTTTSDTLYAHVLEWKGAVATEQWRDRRIVSAKTSPLMAELQQLTRQLSTLNLYAPPPDERDAWMAQIFNLTMRKEQLEQQLAAHSAKLQGAPPKVKLAHLLKILTRDAALIDLLEYTHTTFATDTGTLAPLAETRYVAFIARQGQPVLRVDLGEAQPIADAVANWQKSRGFRPNRGKTDWSASVGELVWSKLQPHVADCATLLVSPDGMLSQLAWNALPGRDPARYLIEDYAIAIVPVPQLLAAKALAPPPPIGPHRPDSLLLVGNVNYNAPVDAGAADMDEGQSQFRFDPLPGTQAEVQALRGHFERRFPQGKVALLENAAATEQAFWQQAPQHRWLHIATHGFFAPANIRSALVTQHRMGPHGADASGISFFNRDYLNGVALAGANVGANTNDTIDAATLGDDGIVTAAEMAMMELRQVEVVVLSGCETGLGDPHPGDGPFGMQRALQIAGAGSTIGSFWTVSDQKTNLLMQRFYANLWDKNLGKLAALREAQLWMLQTGGEPNATQPPKRTSPHYWAAFTLSGDWQ